MPSIERDMITTQQTSSSNSINFGMGGLAVKTLTNKGKKALGGSVFNQTSRVDMGLSHGQASSSLLTKPLEQDVSVLKKNRLLLEHIVVSEF